VYAFGVCVHMTGFRFGKLCPHGFVCCVHMMNILKRDPMRDVNSDLAAILVVASCLVCLVEQSQ
jgi:hypothetical protein